MLDTTLVPFLRVHTMLTTVLVAWQWSLLHRLLAHHRYPRYGARPNQNSSALRLVSQLCCLDDGHLLADGCNCVCHGIAPQLRCHAVLVRIWWSTLWFVLPFSPLYATANTRRRFDQLPRRHNRQRHPDPHVCRSTSIRLYLWWRGFSGYLPGYQYHYLCVWRRHVVF